MILYTEVPIDQIIGDMEQTRKSYQEIRLNGVTMQVEPISAGEARIVRLISPNPNDYLNPAYAPGRTLRYFPVAD